MAHNQVEFLSSPQDIFIIRTIAEIKIMDTDIPEVEDGGEFLG
ncbi:MAG: hypothetical protein WB815_02580 [Nitrososphaeraceae archaeon]